MPDAVHGTEAAGGTGRSCRSGRRFLVARGHAVGTAVGRAVRAVTAGVAVGGCAGPPCRFAGGSGRLEH